MALTPHRSRLLSLAVLGVALCLPATGRATPDRTLSELISSLGSEQITEREEAMRILVSDPALSLRELENQLRDTTLNPEQRCRLLQAAKDRFMQSPRPAMGVQFDSLLPDRVAIEKVYPDFPASNLLKPGDIIVACEGEPLRSRSAWVRLGAHIFAREPGDSINIVVRRGAERLNLEVQLGSYASLQSRLGPGEERLEHAWELRSRRFRPESAEPIVVNLPVDDWRPEPTAVEMQKLARFRDQLPLGTTPRVIAGGEARGGVLDYEELITMARQNPDFALAGGNRGWAAARLQQQLFAQQFNSTIMQTAQQELSALENRRVLMEKQLEALLAVVGPNADETSQPTIQTYREGIARIKLQIEGIKAEAVEEGAKAPEAGPTRK